MASEKKPNESATIANTLPDFLGGADERTNGGSSNTPTNTSGGTAEPGTTSEPGTTNATDTNGGIPIGSAGGGAGNGEQSTSGGTEPSSGGTSGGETTTRRTRRPRTAKPDATANGTATGETPQGQTVLELATPVNINLSSGRRSKAKPISLKSDDLANVLSVGFGLLEKNRGQHWKRTKAECAPFAEAVVKLLPDLPPEVLKTIEKVSPWASLVITGAFLVGPGIIAEYQIAQILEEQKRQKQRGVGQVQPSGQQPTNRPIDTNTAGNPVASAPSGAGTGEISGGEYPTTVSPNDSIGAGVPPFGEFGNSGI